MRIRVLVLEDDRSLAGMMKIFLERRGYEVMTFDDPTSCPLYLQNECSCPCADILISDIRMPHVDGFEFLEHEHQEGCLPQNVALMSGAWSEEDIERATALGCKILEKPLSFSLLNEWLDACEKNIPADRTLSNVINNVSD